MNTSAKPRRSWLRFSLRTLFALVTIVCVWLGLQVKWLQDRQSALRWLEDKDGDYLYYSRWKDSGHTDMVLDGSGYIPIGYLTEPRFAPWSLRILGARGVSRIVLLLEGESDELARTKNRELEQLFPECEVSVVTNLDDLHHAFGY